MRTMTSIVAILTLLSLVAGCSTTGAVVIKSPDGKVAATIATNPTGRLQYSLARAGNAVIETSALGITVDGKHLGRNAVLGKPRRTRGRNSYSWRGVHSTAVNHCRGARIPISQVAGQAACTL